ncbi:YcjF family protein [Pelagibacterium xiamenense]|uniref:YcjF family protein n=1 Tax=Pelagibacterium xiamenense TaxID=2901140 RepID=UPI001E37E19F|nr:TIGR01620 family protein [Pelagibacterium xiamenense]MCD7060036.1 YcjF family protein [Pelagibacterium xiamenense]
MREPRAVPTRSPENAGNTARAPRAFASDRAEEAEDVFKDSAEALSQSDVTPEPRRRGGFWRGLALWTGGTLVSLGLGLAAERLIRDLFARYDWLGWVGLGVLGIFVLALIVLIVREIAGLMRLRMLDALRERAARTLVSDNLKDARAVASHVLELYSGRAELAKARDTLHGDLKHQLDGAEMIRITERAIMAPLDRKARALTAASARRVALVTAVAPRALIDIAFIVFESFRLARNLADLYGARPGLFGFLRLVRAILAHLAVTGGLVLTDGLVEQLVGQGLAAKLSARLGEGVVNGLMTVRVGIAAIRVVRPLPFDTQKSPVVTDFIGDLTRVATEKTAQQ